MQIVEPNKGGSNSIIDSKKNEDSSDEDDDEDEESTDDEVLLDVILLLRLKNYFWKKIHDQEQAKLINLALLIFIVRGNITT